MEAGKVFLK